MLCYPSIYPSIHPFSSTYPGPGHGGSCLSRNTKTSISLDTSSSSSGKIPRHSQANRVTYSLQCVLSLPRGLLLVWHARNTSQGGIRYRCLSHLSWLLSKCRSGGSTLSSSRVKELLTLSLRERCTTLWRKLILTACIQDLIFSVRTQRP